MTTLSIVIPAYNEEGGIAQIVDRVLGIQPDLQKVQIDNLELIVVNDGSKDKTLNIVKEKAEKSPNLVLINHPKNRGYGAALKTGFAKARGELVGFLDADGTYPPEYFPELCKEALKGGDLIIGSRMLGSDSKMPLTRRVGNVFFAGLLSVIGNQQVSDSASGMRVFKKSLLSRLLPLPDGLNLTPVMSTRALHENIKVVEVAIPYSERVGRSKLSVVRDGKIFLESMVWTALSYNPVRILGISGGILLIFSLLVGIGLVAARISGVTQLGPWGIAALFTALVNGVAGISLFALGSTFNYLVSLFYQTPIRQGLLGKPLFKQPLEHNFGWMGLVVFLGGSLFAIITLGLGISGWEFNRLWMYLVGCALFILVGLQLIIYWVLIRVLGELSKRTISAENDMNQM
jgi:glycosyltransferase involved in cell wall biosynthesis